MRWDLLSSYLVLAEGYCFSRFASSESRCCCAAVLIWPRIALAEFRLGHVPLFLRPQVKRALTTNRPKRDSARAALGQITAADARLGGSNSAEARLISPRERLSWGISPHISCRAFSARSESLKIVRALNPIILNIECALIVRALIVRTLKIVRALNA